MAESRKHGYHMTKDGTVEQVGPSGASVLVKTANGNIVVEPAGVPLLSVKAELKAGESIATPVDLVRAHLNGHIQKAGEPPVPPPPEVYEYVPPKPVEEPKEPAVHKVSKPVTDKK